MKIYSNSTTTLVMKSIIVILFLHVLPNTSLFAQEIIPARKDSKWGYIDLWGNIVVPFIFDDAMCFENGNRARVKVGNKWGYINNTGKEIVPCQYEELLDIYTNNLVIVKKNKKWGMLDFQLGKVIIPIQFDTIITEYYNKDIFITKLNNRFSAYHNAKGILAHDYESLKIAHDGNIIVQRRERWGVVDSLGQLLVPIKYKNIKDRYNYYILTSEQNETSYLKSKTLKKIPNALIDGKYRYGLKVVSLEDADVYLNTEGENTIGKKFHTARPFISEIAMVTNFDLSRQCIDTLGNVIFDVPKGIAVGDYIDGDGWILCFNDSAPKLEGLINKEGQVIIEPKFDRIENKFYEKNHFIATKDKNKTLYDSSGKLLIYSEIGRFYDGVCTVHYNNKWGVADSCFNEIIAPLYDSIVIVDKNFFMASKNGRWGYIDSLENIKIPFIYNEANTFYEGLAIVNYKKKYGVINLQNQCRVEFEYDEIRRNTGIDPLSFHHVISEGYIPDRVYTNTGDSK